MDAPAASPGTHNGRLLKAGWPWRLLTLLAVAVAAHLLVSPLGFNPTDDGFILAQSRRILSGEIPHRDFITIRPAGSAYVHVLDLLLGGEDTFLVSRLIYWLEVALTCWCWLEIAISRTGLRPGALVAVPCAALAFMLSSHAFPPMAWHTVDGVLLTSIGFLLVGLRGRLAAVLGYGLIGASAVCKQNFLPMLPLAAVLQRDAGRLRVWAALLTVPGLYVAGLAASGAARDMLSQLVATTGLWESGLQRYLTMPWFGTGVAAGALIAGLVRHDRSDAGPPRAALQWLALVGSWVLLVVTAMRIDAEGFRFIDHDAYLLLGATTGVALASIGRGGPHGDWRSGLFVAALGWCSAISKGYQTPAHAAGPLALMLALPLSSLFDARRRGRADHVALACAVVAVLLVAPRWWAARRDHIYHERTAPTLTHDLGGVLPGGRGVRTNAHTYAMLADLRAVVDRLGGRPYAILVDVPGWWACSPQRNPLPSDWPQSWELCNEDLQTRFSAAVLARRGTLVILIQKANAARVSEGFVPIGSENFYYGAAVWAAHTLERESETRYWTVYR